ncbi:hypothetical protein ASZ90_004367 [hydrocarbon metagenome]|uniref:Uncharacterized protein n=1 Tax=hydrocarbon metagenome TaxID=938273 RepID=A0A0W8FY16_9ZZZZ
MEKLHKFFEIIFVLQNLPECRYLEKSTHFYIPQISFSLIKAES